jgi:hypothetical protein
MSVSDLATLRCAERELSEARDALKRHEATRSRADPYWYAEQRRLQQAISRAHEAWRLELRGMAKSWA